MLGYTYNEEGNYFRPKPAPNVPTVFGSETERFVNGDVTYINFSYGAISATLSSDGKFYFYKNFPGRKFDENGEVEVLSMDKFRHYTG